MAWKRIQQERSGGTSAAVVGKTLIYSGEIDDNFFTFIWENLLKMGADIWDRRQKKVKEDRRLVLNSCGGNTDTMFSIVDLFEHSKALTTVATGDCMSAAVPVIAAGTPGCRFATPRTRFMVHSPWDVSDDDTRRHAETKAKELKVAEKRYAEIMAAYTKPDLSYWLAKLKTDEGYYFDAVMAKELGVIDGIIKAPQ